VRGTEKKRAPARGIRRLASLVAIVVRKKGMYSLRKKDVRKDVRVMARKSSLSLYRQKNEGHWKTKGGNWKKYMLSIEN